MSTLAEIEAAAATLSRLEQEELVQRLTERLQTPLSQEAARPRIAGLHPGAFEVADDFDDPLPNEFWLGKDA